MATYSQETEESSTRPNHRARPRWLVPGLIIAGLAIAATVHFAPPTGSETIATSPEPTQTHRVSPTANLVAIVPTVTPTPVDELILLPTDTPVLVPTAVPDLSVSLPFVTLPTVTPTQPVTRQPITRTLSVSGTAILRMAVESVNFESSGQPLDVDLAPRVYAFGADSVSKLDSWCVQLGLVNILFDLSMELDTDSADVYTSGQIQLRNDFCDAPGAVVDTEEIALDVPADAAVRLTYTLSGDRSLLAVAGVLDTRTSVVIEFILANRRRTTS